MAKNKNNKAKNKGDKKNIGIDVIDLKTNSSAAKTSKQNQNEGKLSPTDIG